MPTTSSVIAIVSVVVSVATVLYARRSTRSTEQTASRLGVSDARREAEALADVRGEVIDDLKDRIANVEKQQAREREDHMEKIELIQNVLDHVKKDAAETQRLLVVGARGAALKILGHLEADPPEVEQAIDYLRDMLNGEAPPPPTISLRRRRAA